MAQPNISDEEIRKIYDSLRDPNRNPDPLIQDLSQGKTDHGPVKFNPDDYKVASGFSRRVAQASTFDQFKEFVLTGVSPVPVKMTPDEMELMMGGGPFATWAKDVGWVAGGAAMWVCSDSGG